MVGSASPAVPRDAPSRLTWPYRVAIAGGGAVVALLACVALATIVEHHMYAHRVLPGVDVDGVSSAGHHEVTVYDSVTRLGVQLSESPIRVRIGATDYSADPSLLELTVDARATAAAAMDAGRHGNPFEQALGTALRWFRPEHVQLHAVYDENRLDGLLDGWGAATDNGMVEGGLRIDGTRVVEVEPHAGTGLVRQRARTALVAMLATPDRPVLTLPVGELHPRVDRAAVAAAGARARRLLAHDITLATGSAQAPVVVKPTQLAAALGTQIHGRDLDVTIDPDRLHDAIGAALAPLESPPVDATFVVTDQNTVNVVPSRDGRGIDMDAVAEAILAGRQQIDAPLRGIVPRRDTKWAESLGIKEPLSSYTTNYPSGEDRVKNIHRGADLLNNTVVEPGQVFSLNDTVGPRTAARGFVSAPVFAQGEFFDDYGGGVSQLATTTYNAAFFAGFQDVTHQPHTIYISRYPPGREATVNYGVIDLKFRDDSPHGVLIRTYYSDTAITVALYGDTEGRTAREENRSQTNPVPVGDADFQCPALAAVDPHNVCATLAAGERDQVSNGDPGLDVAFDRVIDQPGKPERREHYTWHYTMVPNQFVIGGTAGTTSTIPPAAVVTPTSLSPSPSGTSAAHVSRPETTTSSTAGTTPPTSGNTAN